MPQRQAPKGPQWLVYDRSRFAALISRLISERFQSNRSRMSAATGIGESTIRSWENEVVAAVRVANIDQLRSSLRASDWDDLERALVSPDAQARQELYEDWIERTRGGRGTRGYRGVEGEIDLMPIALWDERAGYGGSAQSHAVRTNALARRLIQ